MKTNDEALALIHSFEGFSPTPYLCPAGVWTIGYGSTRTPNGSRVTKNTPALSQEDAGKWAEGDLSSFERHVTRLVKVPVSDNQFGALVSFTYNLGSGNLKASKLRKKINRRDYIGAANEFPKWRRAGGRILAGLVRRRAAERRLYLRRTGH